VQVLPEESRDAPATLILRGVDQFVGDEKTVAEKIQPHANAIAERKPGVKGLIGPATAPASRNTGCSGAGMVVTTTRRTRSGWATPTSHASESWAGVRQAPDARMRASSCRWTK